MLRPVLAIAGGAGLYALALPRFDLWPCAWIALVPLILVVRGRAAGSAAAYGALAGFVSAWAATWWLAKAVAGYFQAGIVVGALAMSAAYAVAVCSAFVLFALGARVLADRGPFALAALWAAGELGRGRVLGQPWGLLGYTQHGEPALIQLAALAGVYGVSFVVALGNAAIAEALWRWRAGAPLGRAARTIVAPGTAIAAVWLGGALVLPPPAHPRLPPVAVGQSKLPPPLHSTPRPPQQQRPSQPPPRRAHRGRTPEPRRLAGERGHGLPRAGALHRRPAPPRRRASRCRSPGRWTALRRRAHLQQRPPAPCRRAPRRGVRQAASGRVRGGAALRPLGGCGAEREPARIQRRDVAGRPRELRTARRVDLSRAALSRRDQSGRDGRRRAAGEPRQRRLARRRIRRRRQPAFRHGCPARRRDAPLPRARVDHRRVRDRRRLGPGPRQPAAG